MAHSRSFSASKVLLNSICLRFNPISAMLGHGQSNHQIWCRTRNFRTLKKGNSIDGTFVPHQLLHCRFQCLASKRLGDILLLAQPKQTRLTQNDKQQRADRHTSLYFFSLSVIARSGKFSSILRRERVEVSSSRHSLAISSGSFAPAKSYFGTNQGIGG